MTDFYYNGQIHTSLFQVTPPAAEPVTLAQAKLQCRVDDDITADDTLISALIVAARQYVEMRLKRAIVTQTWQYNLDIFPFWPVRGLMGPPIALPKPPVQSISSVKYIDPSGTLQTLSTSAYYVDTMSEPARIMPVQGQPWETVNLFTPNTVQIEFVCGYGLPTDNPQTIPQSIMQAILLLVDSNYEQRAGTSDVSLSMVPYAVEAMLDTESTGAYF